MLSSCNLIIFIVQSSEQVTILSSLNREHEYNPFLCSLIDNSISKESLLYIFNVPSFEQEINLPSFNYTNCVTEFLWLLSTLIHSNENG